MKDTGFSKKLKVIAAVGLALALLLSSACVGPAAEEEETSFGEAQPTSVSIPDRSITVPFAPSDSLNPFFVKTLINANILSLLYDSLFCLDGGFSPVNMIASEYTVSAERIRVTIDDSLVFSDSSPVSAADVIYSFFKAKSAPLYEESLKNIESCSLDGTYTVEFSLLSPDINALNLLTFPIVKNGSAEREDDVPVGSGSYVFMRDALRSYLQYNLRHAGGIPKVGTVRLREVSESATLMHVLNTGGIDCFFTDLSDGVAKRSYSGANEVYLNNLVFLGLNFANPRLNIAEFRQALSLSISRTAVVQNAFVSHARAAAYPFNTSWEQISGISAADFPVDADVFAADALLSELGLGINGDEVSLSLVCDADAGAFMRSAAALISEELRYVNINAEVRFLSRDAYLAALQNGDFDLYLGEIKLTKNMDLSPFFTSSGSASYGIPLSELSIDESYLKYRAGALELSAFLEEFSKLSPFLPLVFRNGQFCYSRSIRSAVQSTEDRLFYNITDWEL